MEEVKNESGKLFSFFCKMRIFDNIASKIELCLSRLESTIVLTRMLLHHQRVVHPGLVVKKAGVGGHFQISGRKGVKNI